MESKFSSEENNGDDDKHELLKLPKLKYAKTSNAKRNSKLTTILEGVIEGIYDVEAVKSKRMSMQKFTDKLLVNAKKAFKKPPPLETQVDHVATETWRFIVLDVSVLLMVLYNFLIFLYLLFQNILQVQGLKIQRYSLLDQALKSLKEEKTHLSPGLLPEKDLLLELEESNKKLEVIGKQIAFDQLTAYHEE